MRLLICFVFYLISAANAKLLFLGRVATARVRVHDQPSRNATPTVQLSRLQNVTKGRASGEQAPDQLGGSSRPAWEQLILRVFKPWRKAELPNDRIRTLNVPVREIGGPAGTDGYADTDAHHQRLTPPAGDPVGDGKGWGPHGNAQSRATSPAGEQPENFSLLDSILGPCGSCSPWTSHCSMGSIMSALLMVWTFKNLKVMSDVYFVPSTMALAKRLGMTNDVAGATLLAFGSSAPEFCTNVVASLFITNECGVGDIVGSAIHNILLIVGVSGLFAGRTLALWWYPLSRDSLFFLVSVFELAYFLWDEHLQIWEASFMCCTYLVYCAWMFWNLPIYNNLCSLLRLGPADVPEDSDDEDDEVEGVLYYDPAEVLWRHTMPSVKKSCLSCFLLALFHIAWLSYIMVDAATRFGNIVGIPSLFMGLVFLAAGTSIPDAFASMAAARKGQGDMAVSNALGSNIFDILLGLGLPWLISLLIGKPVVFLGVSRLLYWVGVMVVVMIGFLIVVVGSGWKLGRKMGMVLICAYAFYVLWALLKSFGVVA